MQRFAEGGSPAVTLDTMGNPDKKEASMNVSPAFQAFAQEAPEHQRAWSEAVQALGAASALDDKTAALAYIAVMAAARLESGLPFHVKMAKMHGATRDEVISAVLIGLPAVGNGVTAALPVALEAYDED